MIVKVASINWVDFILVFSHSLFNSEAFDIVHSDFISLFLDNGSNLLEFWHNNFLFVFLFLFLEVLRSSIRNFVKFLFAWNQHKFLHIILSSFALHCEREFLQFYICYNKSSILIFRNYNYYKLILRKINFLFFVFLVVLHFKLWLMFQLILHLFICCLNFWLQI